MMVPAVTGQTSRSHAPRPHFSFFVLVSAIFFAAGIVKGVLGMGLPTFAMGLLGLRMPVPQAASLLTLPPPSTRAHVLAGPVVGATTGLIAGLTGVFVLPAVPYLQSLGLDRDQFAQALGLSFTTSTIALACATAVVASTHEFPR